MFDEVSPIEALNSIKNLLSSEEKHCKYATARDAEGNSTYAREEDAVSWCIEGAYYSLGFDQNMAVKYLHEAAETLYKTGLVKVNDTMGYKALLNVIDEALFVAQEIEDSIEML